MRPHPVRLSLAGLAVTAAIGAASALPAAADTSPSASPSSTSTSAPCAGSASSVLACIKQRSAQAVSNRESALEEMAGDITSSVHIASSDRSTLLAQVQADESGLTALNATIQNDTTVATAHSDAVTIVTGYRVYVLEAPKVHLVIAADTEGAAESMISSVMPAIQTAINDSTASATDRAQAQASYNDCGTQLAAAQSASSGIVAAVIDLQPSEYPGNQPALASARQSAQTARHDLGTCRSDLSKIRSLLRS